MFSKAYDALVLALLLANAHTQPSASPSLSTQGRYANRFFTRSGHLYDCVEAQAASGTAKVRA